MRSQDWRRKRGVSLTPKGFEKLQEGKRKSEAEKNFGNRYTLEEMSERSGLYSGTISKVLNCEGGVDKRTIEDLFKAFDLNLDKSDYLSSNTRTDWGEAISTSVFYGRTESIAMLEQLILNDRCRLVTLLGMGGIGKTTLSVKLAQKIQQNFEYVIWRSLREAPPVEAILTNLIYFLSDEQIPETNLPKTLGDAVSQLIEYLRSSRCLLILDNLESILCGDSRVGLYTEGYEGYGDFLRRLGETTHQSCLLLTSREKPKEIALLEGEKMPVRSLRLGGLNTIEGQEILKLKGISGTEEEWTAMIGHYAGNPLALKIVATTIQDVFDSNISEFLKQDRVVLGDIQDILDQQFDRLSDVEKNIMYWLAINREPISFQELQEDIILPIPQAKIVESLESLLRRSLIEKTAALFTLQPVLMAYVTEQLVNRVCSEIVLKEIALFRSHALMKATAPDYVKDAQVRLIIKPVIDGLLSNFRSKKRIENQLTQILAKLREISPLEQSYEAGNILNLLCYLQTDLNGYDFSDLTVWQADLQNVKLQNVNFQNANLAKSVFGETLGGIHSVAFSPNGKLLATGDTNGEIRLYQVVNWKQILSIKGHRGFIWPVTFSPDGHLLASGSDDQMVKLWDVSTGKCLVTLEGHNGCIWSIAFNPQGKMLASGSEDHMVKLWDVSTAECLKTFWGHSHRVTSVAFSPQGSMLASSSDDQTVKLWDASTGECLKTLQSDNGGSRSVAFSPNGQTLANGCCDNQVRLWDVGTGCCFQTLLGHSHCVNSVAFSSDGYTLASGSDDQVVKLWDISTGHCLTTLQGHNSRVSSVAFSPQGTTLASGSEDQAVKLWDVSTGECLKTLQGYCNGIWSAAFSPQGTMLASGSGDQTVRLWDAITGECLKTLRGHSNRVTSIAFNPQGTMLASGSEDQTVRLWDAITGECLKTLRGHSNRVTSIAFSPQGTTLASGSEDQTVKLWDVRTGECLTNLQEHNHWVWAVAFCPDGHLLASGCHDQTVKLWDVRTGECLTTLYGHTDWIWSVTFSPDGLTLASGSSDQTVKLWDVRARKCIETLQGHTNSVYSVVFLDDYTLFSGSGDKTVKLWDLGTSSCVRTFLGHSKLVWSLDFSTNGQTLISSSEDETIKLWNLKTGDCLKTMKISSPYEGMNITGVTGVTLATIMTLKTFGAVEYPE